MACIARTACIMHAPFGNLVFTCTAQHHATPCMCGVPAFICASTCMSIRVFCRPGRGSMAFTGTVAPSS
ncbi:hypothetical protein BRADI_1g07885v3 [Brachypodium distachyon]|uniref:Uncharacterized protein n=1 Tax=Brachypodium distachyon TaxID=15368 RepID=A0A2K2DIK1_BRADI|nr:hypothetical protein BRADI_1g07885v3 [Brachypodium distachyon]